MKSQAIESISCIKPQLPGYGFLRNGKDPWSTMLFGKRQVHIFGALIKANPTYGYDGLKFTVNFDTTINDCLVWVAFHNRDGGMPVLTSATSADMNAFPDDLPRGFRHQVHEYVSRLYGLPGAE